MPVPAPGLLGAAARGAHDCEPDRGADRVCEDARSRGAEGLDLRRALFPSVGSVLIAGVVTSTWWPRLETRQKRALVAGVLLFPLIFFPVYRSRTARWVSDARLSQSVLRQLAEVAADSDVETIVLRDDPSSRANLASAIGSALPNISALISDRPLALRMERRLPGAPVRASLESKAPNSHEIVMSLDGQTGRLNIVRE